jgi:hypothetical protein
MEVSHELIWCGYGVSSIAFDWTAVEGATSYGLMLIPVETLHPVYYFGTIDPGKTVGMGDLMLSNHQIPTGDYYYTVYANGAEFQECYAGVHAFTLGNLSSCGLPPTSQVSCPDCCEPPAYTSEEAFCTAWCGGDNGGCMDYCTSVTECYPSEGSNCVECIMEGNGEVGEP